MNIKLVQLILLLFSSFSESSKLVEKAVLISNSEFKHRVQTSVVWWRSDPEHVVEFLTRYHGSVKTININAMTVNETIPFPQTVLFVTMYDEFLYFVNKMDTQIPTPSKVIVILPSIETDSHIVNSIIETAWNNDIADLIILTFISARQTVELYTYFPYSSGSACGNLSVVKLDPKKDEFFPRKYNNFHGCEVKYGGQRIIPYFLCTSGNEGIFEKFDAIVFERLNTKLNVSCLPAMPKQDSRILNLTEKNMDAFSYVLLDRKVLSRVQSSTVLYFCETTWFGPPQRELYAWAKLIIPMISNITALLGAAFIVIVVVLKVIHRAQPCEAKRKSPQIITNTLAIFLGQQANYVSKSLIMNLLFLLWIWFSLIVGLIYQGELVRGLLTQHMEPRFGTLENAIKLLDGYGGTEVMRNYQNNTPIEDNFEVFPYSKVIASIPEIANGKRLLLSTDKLRLKGYKSLQFLDKSIIRLPMAMMLRPRWGAAAEINSLVLRSAESGFLQKQFHDFEVKTTREIVRNSTQHSSVRSLDLVTISACFYGLAIMYLVCFIVLCVEIFYNWLLTPRIKGVFAAHNANKSHLS